MQVAIVIASLYGAAVVRPLADDAAGIMGFIAIDRAIIHAALDEPAARRAVVLVADDTTGKAVRLPAGKLSAHKGPVEQEGQILLCLVHADHAAGTHADAAGLVDQEPVAAGAITHLASRRVIPSHTAQVAVAGNDELHGAAILQSCIIVVPHLLDPVLFIPLDPGRIRRELLFLGVFQQVTDFGHPLHQLLRAGVTGQGDGTLVVARHAAYHAVLDDDAAGSVGIVADVAGPDGAGGLVFARDAADVGGERLFLGGGAGAGGGVDSGGGDGEVRDGVAVQQAPVQARDAAVAVAHGALALVDGTSVGAGFDLGRVFIGQVGGVLADDTAEIVVVAEVLEVGLDGDILDRAALGVQAHSPADGEGAGGDVVVGLLGDGGAGDRAGVFAHDGTKGIGLALEIDPAPGEDAAGDGARGVVHGADGPLGLLAPLGEGDPVVGAVHRAVGNGAVILADHAPGIAVVAGDVPGVDAVLDLAALAVLAHDAARCALVGDDFAQILGVREEDGDVGALLSTNHAAGQALGSPDELGVVGQGMPLRAAQPAPVDARDAADLALAGDSEVLIGDHGVAGGGASGQLAGGSVHA